MGASMRRGLLMTGAAPVSGGDILTAFDPANKHANVVLSNNDFTMNGTAIGGQVRSLTFQNSGKWYFEAIYEDTVANYGNRIGLIRSDNPLSYEMGAGYSIALLPVPTSNEGQIYYTNVKVVNDVLFNVSLGDVIMVAYIYATGEVWFGVNGVWYNSGDPALGTNPTYQNATLSTGDYYIGASSRASNQKVTINSPTNFNAPNGFLPWV